MNLIFKWLITLFVLSVINSALATPDSFEIWFLSKPGSAFLNNTIEQNYPRINFSKTLFALNDYMETARPMGDGYYFHPQIGLFKKNNDGSVDSEDTLPEAKDEKEVSEKFFSASGTNMIHCDRNSPFDLFCGKEQKINKKNPTLEIWVDISSSMRAVDYSDQSNHCGRRNFVDRLLSKCNSDKVAISSFDVYKYSIAITKERKNLDSLCGYRGLNDQDLLIKWIEESKSKKLIIITDIAEYTSKLSNFAENNGGKIVGGDKRIFSEDLLKMVSEVSRFCM